jgi:hypothetical protein
LFSPLNQASNLSVRNTGYTMTDPENQAWINSLKSFVPGMVGRSMLPVRAQSCGDCYAFGTSHSITSAYAQANSLDVSDAFSPQRLMNCALVSYDDTSKRVLDSGSGCFGGSSTDLIDMLVHKLGGKMPFPEDEPYVGFQGFCDDPKRKGVDTGKWKFKCL